MIGKITVKRMLKKGAGFAAAAEMAIVPDRRPRGVCVLMYHRVAEVSFVDPSADDWNVPPEIFEAQIASIMEYAEVVPLMDVLHRGGDAEESSKPLVALTFDDGYANFHANVLPVLSHYAIPATLFVVTSAIGKPGPMSFDVWARNNCASLSEDAYRPANWSELERCKATGLVCIGSHSHSHRNGLGVPLEQLFIEAEESRATLRSRLGDDAAVAYAYPYGSRRLGQVSIDYVEAVREAGYSLAVTTDLGLARPTADPLAIPRVEVHALDRPRVIRAKIAGRLLPYRLTDFLRRARRAA
jgi:peptidoglycan/xylan/chitin deacetylase (PgdA/CDA1 family)